MINAINRTQELQDRVRAAASDKTPLTIVGGNSKAFYGNPCEEPHAQRLETRIHQGIISYEPSELVLTARAGTSLRDIEALLAENGQMLPFEPPHFSEHSTLGGAVASGLSGSRRPWTGAVRDFVLGVKLINGKGDILSFGGQVMKNVAGYDVSRLMVGALGTLGVLLEISIKVLPRPHSEQTVCMAMEKQQALRAMRQYDRSTLPLSAMLFVDDTLYLRLSGAGSAVDAAVKQLQAEPLLHAEHFWQQINTQSHPFFQQQQPLWRLSVPAIASIEHDAPQLIDWGGAQYWLHSDTEQESLQQLAAAQGGHACVFRDPQQVYQQQERFMPLAAKIKQFHINLKMRFDPWGILNYGRLYRYL